MVSVCLSKLGYTSLIFVNPGVKVNGAYYHNVLLLQPLIPTIRQVSGEFFICQQDSAPAHRAREMISLLERETPAFILPDLWPPNSRDYKIWGVMQQCVYQTKVQDVNDLKRRLVNVWADMQQSVIDDAIDQWQKHLHTCVRARGGHFEHVL